MSESTFYAKILKFGPHNEKHLLIESGKAVMRCDSDEVRAVSQAEGVWITSVLRGQDGYEGFERPLPSLRRLHSHPQQSGM